MIQVRELESALLAVSGVNLPMLPMKYLPAVVNQSSGSTLLDMWPLKSRRLKNAEI
jgi:hypothetical protein